MKTKPKEFVLLALFLVLVALSMPLQVSFLYGYLPWEFGALLNGLTPLNWAVAVSALACAAAVYQASRAVLALAPAFLVLVLWNNFVVLSVPANYSGSEVLGGTIFVIAALALLFREPVVTALRYPERRWWRTPPRSRLSLRARVCPVMGGELFSHTVDVSRTGAYVALHGAQTHGTVLSRLVPGMHCSFRLNLNQHAYLSCGGRIVRVSEAGEGRPAGFAVQFLGLSPRQRRYLDRYLAAPPALVAQAVAAAA